MAKVSVVIPSYNHEKYITEVIQSVLDQTYQDFEIIITDDGSTDRTVEKIKKFDDQRIKFFCFKKNQGAVSALNNCIQKSKGRYIAVLNSDDAFLPNKLKKQVKFLDTHPKVAAVFSYPQLVDEQGNGFTDTGHFYYNIFKQSNRTRFEWLNYFFYKGNCLCHPSVLIRKRSYEKVGYYDERFAQLPDFDFWIRLCLKNEIFVIPNNLIKLRIIEKELNVSAPGRVENRVRDRTELGHILKNYLKIKKIEEFLKIFPQAERFAEKKNDELIPFLLARVAIESDSIVNQNFGVAILFDLLKDKDKALEINKKYKFSYIDFFQITGKHDLYNLELANNLRNQVNSFQSQLQQKIDEVGSLKNELLQKTTQLEKTRTLVDIVKREIEEKNDTIKGIKEKLEKREKERLVLKKEKEKNVELKKKVSALEEQVQNLESILNKIKSAKFFRLWQAYCRLRKTIIGR